MKETKWPIVIILLLCAALLLSLYLHGSNRQELRELKAQKQASMAETEQNQQVQQQQSLRQQADEAFIQGDYDRAASLYTQAGLPEQFVSARQQRAKSLQQTVDSLRSVNNQLGRLQAGIASDNGQHQNNPVLPDSVVQRHIRQQASLKLDLARQRMTIDSLQVLIAKQKNEQRILEFVNEKGNRVYYLGEQRNGTAQGKGVGLWETGGMYKGQWRNNLRHGEGSYTWADGERYEGSFNAGMREGQGTYYFKNGEKYVGSWKADKRHGEGTIFDKKGKVNMQGIWDNDELKNSGSQASK